MNSTNLPFQRTRRVLGWLCTGLIATLFCQSTVAQSCVAVSPGPVAWWPGNANAFEVVGGRNATLSNGTTYAPGKVGMAFSFDGIDDQVRATLNGDMTGGTKYSWEAWIYPTKAADPSHDIYPVVISTLKTGCAIGAGGYSLYLSGNNTISFRSAWTTCDSVLISGGFVPLNTWTHVAATTFTASNGTHDFKLYVNGQLVSSLSTFQGISIPGPGSILIFGSQADNAGGNRVFKGLIDEPSLFNRDLSAAEIQAIYAAGAAGKCIETGRFPTALLDNTAGEPSARFLGPPDDVYSPGIGLKQVTYDFGTNPVLDLAGPDLNVYEVDFGSPEFYTMDVLVSSDGVHFISIKSTEAAKAAVLGAEKHNDPLFGRSYDLAGSGLAAARYVRIQGQAPLATTDGFDLDAIAAVHSGLPPSANAGPDQAVFDRDNNDIPTVVTLDGRGSSGSGVLTYTWSQIAGPAVTLSDAQTAQPSFIAPSLANHPSGEPVPIAVSFRLVLGSSSGTSQDDVTITVKHDNLPPTARATSTPIALEGTLVLLDGSASSDADLDPLAYIWTQTSGAPVTLSNNNGDNPLTAFSYLVPEPHCKTGETFEFVLTVTDGISASSSSPVTIFIQNVNHSPIVDAGADQTVCDDIDSARLQGSATDLDGDSISSYTWTQIAGPPVALLNTGTAIASFTPPFVSANQAAVTLTFELTASDACYALDPAALVGSAAVNVLVKHANRAPVADPGGDKTVPEGAFVTLDGSGSFDPDNDPIVTYSWAQIEGSIVSLSNGSAAQPTFTAPDVGPQGATLKFALQVTDSPSDEYCGTALTSEPKTVAIKVNYVNHTPIVQASSPVAANEGSPVHLLTSASDPDDNPLTFLWTQISGPTVALDLSNPAIPSFIAPQVGCDGAVLAFQLVVDDGYGGTDETLLEVDVANLNNPPLADAGVNLTVPEGASVGLFGANSSDPDGESLTYNWVQVSGPAVTLNNAATSVPSFVAPLLSAGGDENASITLAFELTAIDTCGASATDQVEVRVANVDHKPVADAGGSQSGCEGTLILLNGSFSSDPDGDGLSYTWTQISGPTVAIAGANSALASIVAPTVAPGGATLLFQLTVADGFGGVASDTAQVAVLNCNTPPDCSHAKASVATLWPPNHSLVPVTVVGIQDPDNDAVIRITAVTQDEPINGLGSGDTAPDAIIRGNSVLLRAERSGLGNGRVYHIHFIASDGESSCSGVVTVGVPHDKASDTPIDNGELYNSLQ